MGGFGQAVPVRGKKKKDFWKTMEGREGPKWAHLPTTKTTQQYMDTWRRNTPRGQLGFPKTDRGKISNISPSTSLYIHRGKEKEKYLQRKGERYMTLIPGFCMGIVSISLSLSVTLMHRVVQSVWNLGGRLYRVTVSIAVCNAVFSASFGASTNPHGGILILVSHSAYRMELT
jgi:hypothetical protein